MPTNYTPHSTPFRLNADEFNGVYEELDTAIEEIRNTPIYTEMQTGSLRIKGIGTGAGVDSEYRTIYAVSKIGDAVSGGDAQGSIIELVTESDRDNRDSSKVYFDRTRFGSFTANNEDNEIIPYQVFLDDDVYQPSSDPLEDYTLGEIGFRVLIDDDEDTANLTGNVFMSASIKAILRDDADETNYGSKLEFGLTANGGDTYDDDAFIMAYDHFRSNNEADLGQSFAAWGTLYTTLINMTFGTDSTPIYIEREDLDSEAQIVINNADDTNTNSPSLTFYRSSGTDASSPATILNTHRLGRLNFAGWNGSLYATRARLQVIANEAWDGSGQGTYFDFQVTDSNTTSLTSAYQMDYDAFTPLVSSDLGTSSDRWDTGYIDNLDMTSETDSTAFPLFMSRSSVSGGIAIGIHHASTTSSDGAFIDLFRSSGTSATSPTATANNDLMGGMRLKGWTGSAWRESAAIVGYAGEDHDASGSGGRLVFQVTRNGETSLTNSFAMNYTTFYGLGGAARDLGFEGTPFGNLYLEDLVFTDNNSGIAFSNSSVGGRTFRLTSTSNFLRFQETDTSGGSANTMFELNRTNSKAVFYGTVDMQGNIEHSGTRIGFFGVSTVTRPTVTGSWGGNAAGANLAAALEDLGLIINSTT